MRAKHRKPTILLALTSTHHGFYHGAARYAAEHDWHVVADMIYDATIPVGWKGDGILSFVGHWEELAKFVVSAHLPVVEISSVRKDLGIPLGIFCYNDCVAADIVDACIESGIRIPDEVAVLGVDNDPVICDCVQVPLSSVRHDLEGMAYEAAALLDRLMNGGSPPEIPKRIAPKGVVTRKSTEVLAVENSDVAS